MQQLTSPSFVSRRALTAVLTLVLLAALGGLNARAAALHWDANGDTVNTGGDGNWNTADLTWRDSLWPLNPLTNWTNGDSVVLPAAGWPNNGVPGTLTLTDDITATGINAGQGGYTIEAAPGKSLTLDATAGGYTIVCSTLTISAPVVLTGGTLGVQEAGNGILTFDGIISQAGSEILGINLSWNGGSGGTMVLNGDNTFSGTVTVNGNETLVLGHNNAAGTGTLVMNGGSVAAANGDRIINNAIGTAGWNNPLNFTGSDRLTLSQSATYMSNNWGGGEHTTLTVTDPAGTVRFAGGLTQSGGSGGFEKAGAGTLQIDTSFSSNTTSATGILVSGGTLILNATTPANQNNFTVNSGAAIGGNGTINLGGGKVLTLANGANFYFDPSATLTVDGGSVDLGNLSIADILNLDGSTAPGTYTLIDGTASFITTNLQNIGPDEAYALGGDARAYFEVGSLSLVVAVPEPASLSLLVLGGIACLRRRARVG